MKADKAGGVVEGPFLDLLLLIRPHCSVQSQPSIGVYSLRGKVRGWLLVGESRTRGSGLNHARVLPITPTPQNRNKRASPRTEDRLRIMVALPRALAVNRKKGTGQPRAALARRLAPLARPPLTFHASISASKSSAVRRSRSPILPAPPIVPVVYPSSSLSSASSSSSRVRRAPRPPPRPPPRRSPATRRGSAIRPASRSPPRRSWRSYGLSSRRRC